jgi:hypothetical protein
MMEAAMLQPGMYTATIMLKNENTVLMRTIKFVKQ